MEQIVECVPNFSEGRDARIIGAIGDAVRNIAGVKLLGVEPDKDYNRTVVTFVGSPEAVVTAAFEATRTAAELIDMRAHHGAHPRLGATDVVPFIPVRGASMDDCVELAKQYARRVGDELHIPVYLYEYAAATPARRNLADVRKGEYEGLAAKLGDPTWLPDFGPAVFNERSGGTIAGARKILIAYNVNLNIADAAAAQEIALRIREIGRPMKDEAGTVMKDERVITFAAIVAIVSRAFLRAVHRRFVAVDVQPYMLGALHFVKENSCVQVGGFDYFKIAAVGEQSPFQSGNAWLAGKNVLVFLSCGGAAQSGVVS